MVCVFQILQFELEISPKGPRVQRRVFRVTWLGLADIFTEKAGPMRSQVIEDGPLKRVRGGEA